MWIPNNKELFEQFMRNKDKIESVIGERLNWDKLENKKASRISTTILGFSFKEKENYANLSNKIIDKLVLFRSAFKQFI
jgi:hypothetical protein